VADASLRLVRGGAGFLEACTVKLRSLGAPAVISPPLPGSAQRSWRAAGYEEFLRLALMRLDLHATLSCPDHLIVEAARDDLDPLLRIDRAAFPRFWRFDHLGLQEALDATTKSRVFVVRGPECDPVAYAVVGYGHAISYLQRVAVHPDWQGQGMGRSLVRAAARSARDAGSHAMLLNTQLDNAIAIHLYEREGYVTLPESLTLLRAD